MPSGPGAGASLWASDVVGIFSGIGADSSAGETGNRGVGDVLDVCLWLSNCWVEDANWI